MIPLGSTLSFNDLERSSSLTSWMVYYLWINLSLPNLWIRKRIVCCCNWGWVLFLSVYLGSLGTIVFMFWGDSPSIAQFEWHASDGEGAKWTCERCHLLIVGMDSNMIVARIFIQKAEVTRSFQSVQNLVDEWEREVVLLGHKVQLLVVDVDSPLRRKACLDFLALLVHRDRYSSCLRNNMYRTHPLAIGYGVDDFCVGPLKNFFFHGLPYLWVESSLGFPEGSWLIL